MILGESERLDFTRVPSSRGIPKRVYFVLAVGMLGIFIMGYLSVILSGYGHMWPWERAVRTSASCTSANAQTCASVGTPAK